MTPRVNGCAALPTTDDSRSPATVTSRLHAEGQSCGQTLGTNRILVRWRADAQPLRSTEPVQDARQSAPRGPVRDRLLLPGHVVPAEPADHDRAEGARALRRSGRDVLLDHDAAVAHQAPLRIALGLRAALGLPAQELLSPDDRAGRARGRDAGDGRRSRLLVAGRVLHDHGPRTRVHGRAHRRVDGGGRQAARPHRRVPVGPVGGDLLRDDAGRHRRRLHGGASGPPQRVRDGHGVSPGLAGDGARLRARRPRAQWPRSLSRDAGGDSRSRPGARRLDRRRVHLLLDVQSVVRSGAAVLPDRPAP